MSHPTGNDATSSPGSSVANSGGNSGGNSGANSVDLTVLYDGACPLCLREVNGLQRRDQVRNGDEPRLAFVDIDRADYNPEAHAGISYAEAMGRIHAITAEGEVLRDVAVFRRAYALVGLGWLYAPTHWPLLRQLADLAYGLWAAGRLRLTGRPNLETLCRARSGSCRPR